jgi:hypothetical protein
MERPAQDPRCWMSPVGEDGKDGGLAVCAHGHLDPLRTTLDDTRLPHGADANNGLVASSSRGKPACPSRGPNDESRRAVPGRPAGWGAGRAAADLLKSEKTQTSVLDCGEGFLGLSIDGSGLGLLRRVADDAGHSLFTLVVTLYVAAVDRGLPCGNGELIVLPSGGFAGCDEAIDGGDGGAGGESDGVSRLVAGSAAHPARTSRRAGEALHGTELPHSMQMAIAGSGDLGSDELARDTAGVALDRSGRVWQGTALRYVLGCAPDARIHSLPSNAASGSPFSMLTEVRESADGLRVYCCFRAGWRSAESAAAIAEEFLHSLCRAAGIA